MKKVLLALVAVIGIFALSSCSKTCNCKAWGSYGGDGGDTSWTQELKDGEKCSDFNKSATIAGISAGIKCTPQLF